MENMFKTLNPTEIKVGSYVLCTQKNGNQFIGKVSDVRLLDNTIKFEFTLLDNGEQMKAATGNISDFTYVDVTSLKDVIDLLLITSEPTPETVKEETCNTSEDTVDFNEEQWLTHMYPLVTRDGASVRIIDREVKGHHHILALIDRGDEEMPVCYDSQGRAGIGNDTSGPRFKGLDLLMVVEKIKPVTKYAYVYRRDNTGTTFMSQLMDSTDELKNLNIPAGCSIIATVPVNY